MFTIPVTFALQRTYPYQSSTPSESQLPLSYWTPSSVTIFSHWTLHISFHFKPAFRQQQLSNLHALLHEQESSSSTSSGAGLDPSHTNFATFEILSTSQPCPPGEGITGRGTLALFQIAAGWFAITWSRKKTRTSAKPLARPSCLWLNGSHSASYPHFGTSSRTSDTRGPPYI